MPRRKKSKGADYEYVGTARSTTSQDTEYASENAMNPQTTRSAEAAEKGGSLFSEYGSECGMNAQTKGIEQQARQGTSQDTEYASENIMNPQGKRIEQQAKQGSAGSEYASEVAPSPGKRDETRAKPKGHC